ncbi:MAG: hypothetical protein PHD95_06880 [Candidatus ainarchaeum sp.]|nr:hypothetical protein [Candidatus ainarchaeum sp.]
MDFTAQSAPFYMLIFSSVLVLLITAVAVFFVVLSPKLVCYSSDPQLTMENYSLPYSKNYVQAVCPSGNCNLWGYIYNGDSPGKMSLKNSTGSGISISGIMPYNKSYYKQELPACSFVQLFVPYYLNGKSYNEINAGKQVKISSDGGIVINGLFLSQEAIGPCKASDFYFPPAYSFSIDYAIDGGLTKTAKITCEGVPEKN